jgi:hypothetical protein
MATYIPQKDFEFDRYYKNYCQIVNTRTGGSTPEWTHIPAPRVSELNGGYADWYTAWSAYLADMTAILRAGKNDAKKAGTKTIQDFTNEFIRYSRAVSLEDKRGLGVNIPSGTWTPVLPPDTAPGVDIRQMGPGIMGIIYRHLEGRKGSKPPGVTGARAFYGIYETPPTDQLLLPASVWMTRCPAQNALHFGLGVCALHKLPRQCA